MWLGFYRLEIELGEEIKIEEWQEVLVRVNEGQVADYALVWAEHLKRCDFDTTELYDQVRFHNSAKFNHDENSISVEDREIKKELANQVYNCSKNLRMDMLFKFNSNSSLIAFDNSPLKYVEKGGKKYLYVFLSIVGQTKARNPEDEIAKIETSIYIFPDMGFQIPFLSKILPNHRIKIEIAIPRYSIIYSLLTLLIFYFIFFKIIIKYSPEYHQILTGNIPQTLLTENPSHSKQTKTD